MRLDSCAYDSLAKCDCDLAKLRNCGIAGLWTPALSLSETSERDVQLRSLKAVWAGLMYQTTLQLTAFVKSTKVWRLGNLGKWDGFR